SHRRARELREQLVREHPDVPEHQNQLARTYNNLATLHAHLGQQAEALACLTESRRLREGLRDGPLGGTEELQTDLAKTYLNIGTWHFENRQLAEGLGAFRQARALLNKLYAAHHTSVTIK